jgi:mRNA interferase MazF
MGVTRGDIVVVASRGAYTNRPRPALVVQSDLYNATHASISICPVTSDLIDAPLFRVALPPGARTGLKAASQVMVDKVVSVPRSAIGKSVGRCLPQELDAVDEALRTWLAL